MEFVDQYASELRLNLVQGYTDVSRLSVLCSGNIPSDYARLEVGILGASHYFSYSTPSGTPVFTEVFVCTEVEDIGNRVFFGDLHDASHIKKHFGDLTYDFTAKKHTWGTGEDKFKELLMKVESKSDEHHLGLMKVFPRREEDPFLPVTMVFLSVHPNNLQVEVETLHAYPNDDALVFTKTTVTKK